jgi:hypothetical protein
MTFLFLSSILFHILEIGRINDNLCVSLFDSLSPSCNRKYKRYLLCFSLQFSLSNTSPFKMCGEGLLGVAGGVAAGPLADPVGVQALAQRRDAVGWRGGQALPVYS